MILVNVLAVSVLISLAKSMPHHRSDANDMVIQIPYRKATWNPEDYYEDSSQNEQTGTPALDNSESSNVRRKKIGSLSITNPMDVLRQRYLLELARRRQMQQREQAKVNREILNDIGKRAIGHYKVIYPSIQTRNRPLPPNQASSNDPDWSRPENFDWYDIGTSGDRNDEADESNKMDTNEIHLL